MVDVAAHQVAFSHGRRRALHAVSTTFSTGATMLLGANGAGKSTLLELLAGVRRPDAGTITVDGVSSVGRGRERKAYRRLLAWLPQQSPLVPGLTVREHAAYAGWLKGMSRSEAWTAAQRAVERVGLSELTARPVRQLSGGQARRAGLAGALVHDARVLLLDEPTSGLDPSQRRQFREILQEVADERVVLVSSHDTDEAHAAFDRIAVLRDGELVFHGAHEEFVADTSDDGDMRDRIEAAYARWAGEDA